MGSIRERKKGRFEAIVRNGKEASISATFDKEESAKLWMEYKERLFNEMKNFDVPKKDLIFFRDAIELKKKSLSEKGSTSRTVVDINTLLNTFSEFNDLEIGKISYDMLLNKSNNLLNSITRKGGSKKNPDSGRKQQMSPHTVLSRLRQLSSVYSNLIEMGVQIDNIPIKVLAYLKNIIDEKLLETGT